MNERDRMLQVMQAVGMNAKQFCQEVGISPGTLSNITGGRNKPSLEVMQAVLRRFRSVSCDWLIMGIGTMYNNGVREEGVLSLFADEQQTSENTTKAQTATLPLSQAQATSTADNTLQPNSYVAAPRSVTKILVFYSDGTFEER